MLTERIQHIITEIGLKNCSQDPHSPLEQGGLDSLMLALLIIELEREFKVKIPVIPLIKTHYESIASIENHLIELGAQ